MPCPMRRSSSTDLTSEPSCSAWPRRCACSLAVELSLDAVGLAVEQVDEGPQQIGEIVLEAGAGQHGAEGLDHRVELAVHGVGFGQGARIGFVLAGAMAVERELVEQMRGGRGGVRFGIEVGVGEGEGAFVA